MPNQRASLMKAVAAVSVALMGACGYGLTGQYGFEWMPRWGFLAGLLAVLVLGGSAAWYLAAHHD